MLRFSKTAGRRLFSSKAPRKIVTFDGDGVGPELMVATKKIVQHTGVNVQWIDHMNIGLAEWQRSGGGEPSGRFMDEAHLKLVEEHGVVLKGPLTIPPGSDAVEVRGKRYTSANQVLRKHYQLHANIRPAQSVPGMSRFEDVDLVVVRENTEDLYTGEEHWQDDDTAICIKRITRGASTRIAQTAFDYARSHKRSSVTAVHKANVCKITDGLFLACAREVAAAYPDVEYKEQLADSLLTRMVQEPSEFDVLLCPNLFGDLVSDLAAGLIGSLGLMPSAQYGSGSIAVFEPAHGSAPDIAGLGQVNPVSLVRSAALMLHYIGETEAAHQVETAVAEVLKERQVLTPDLGGSSSTDDMVAAIIKAMD